MQGIARADLPGVPLRRAIDSCGRRHDDPQPYPRHEPALDMVKAKEITGKQRDGLLRILQARFEAHRHRHADLEWTTVKARVESSSAKLWSLNEMEQSGGEPDVVGVDQATRECIFVDCSAQSPKGRRSV